MPRLAGAADDAHRGVEDPAAFVGSDEETYKLFRNVCGQFENRIKIFSSLPIRSLDRLSLQKRIEEIGRTPQAAPAEA